MDTIGVIGLGLMGGALAERFHAAGMPVVGYDLRTECRSDVSQLGGTAVESVSDVFRATRTIVLSLPNSDVVAEVVRDRVESFQGGLIIDTTTGDPEATHLLGMTLAESGIEYLDATLTGSSTQARAGELVVTAGGPHSAYVKAEALFPHFARKWFHVGQWGSGARAKLVVNLILGLNRAVLAEGLTFAGSMGIDLDQMLEILQSGAAYSRAMDIKGRKMIDGDFRAEAKLSQHLKDVRLILESGLRTGALLPFSRVHHELLQNLANDGFGENDNSAIIRAFDTKWGQP